MDNRKQIADAKYRRRFYELGINGFDYIRFESTEQILFRCKKCGTEFARGNDLFKGKQNKLICHECGNGMVCHSELADKVLEYYAEGHTDTETINKFGITENDLKNWAKVRKVSNGRKFGYSSNELRIRDSETEARQIAEQMGYVIFGVWQGGNHYYSVIDTKTGRFETMRGTSFFPHKKSKSDFKKRNMVVVDDDITTIGLIKRDGRRCYICGKETDFRDKRWGRWGPDFPTIEHVIPIKHGGTHSWGNVRLACGLCNAIKGAKYEETIK